MQCILNQTFHLFVQILSQIIIVRTIPNLLLLSHVFFIMLLITHNGGIKCFKTQQMFQFLLNKLKMYEVYITKYRIDVEIFSIF